MAKDMRIRRFEAPDSKTALAMVKAELGDDAVILANRTIPSGSGMGRPYGRTMVEVVAAMDYDLYSIAGYSDIGVEQSAAVVPVTVEEKSTAPGKGGFMGELEKMAETQAIALGSKSPQAVLRVRGKGVGLGARWRQQLIRSESRPAANGTVRGGAKSRPAPPGLEGESRRKAGTRPLAEDVARWREQLIERIQYNSIFTQQGSSQRIVALVGPTGVGKTTSLAKIAAHARLHMGLKVGLVSMDCYRIGANDQLRTYGRIMHMPCEVALREKDLLQVIAIHSDCDLILIDTAGKSPYDEGHVGELSRWFAGVCPQVEPFLTISATTKKEDLKTVFDRYRKMHIGGLILTKLDETRAYATLCQQLAAGEIPLSCLGTGQRVPEDLMQASAATVGLLFREGWQAFMDSWAANPAKSMRAVAV